MNLETVNELIASLDTSGELTIREEKFLKLAKAYQQLAAENVGLKAANNLALNILNDEETMVTSLWASSVQHVEVTTPATDRIYAGNKADGVEEMASTYRGFANEDGCSVNMRCSYNLTAERAESYAAYIRREGAK